MTIFSIFEDASFIFSDDSPHIKKYLLVFALQLSIALRGRTHAQGGLSEKGRNCLAQK